MTIYISNIYITHGPGPVIRGKKTQQMKHLWMSAAAGDHAAWHLQGHKWSFVCLFFWLLEATHSNTAGDTPSHSRFELTFINKEIRAVQMQSPVMWLPAWQSLQTLPQTDGPGAHAKIQR